MSYNFIFFYVDTIKGNSSDNHKSMEREDIQLFINSIKKHHPKDRVIHCTDNLTDTFENIDKTHRERFNMDELMVGKIKCFSRFRIKTTSIYLDPDILIMKAIPIKHIEDKADVFLLKRSFDLDAKIPKTFRKLEYENHVSKFLGEVYPYIACFVILKSQVFWEDCLKMFDDISNNYKNWFGDQEIFKILVKEKKFKFGFLEEKEFACPPQYLSGKSRPFTVHFKGKNNKKLIKKYYNYI